MTLDGVSELAKTIPETVYLCFQLTFAIITPALIAGAFAERMKFSAMMWFMALWSLIVYAPIAHWVWGGGFLGDWGVLDFAGGTVVHINAGVAGLVCALVLGKRRGFGVENMAPHNLVYSVIGASLLWVGWFGFNAGSAGGASGNAGMAMAVTQFATAAAALSWMFAEWATRGKPSVLGIISGAVAGLVAITPASGFVNPMGALVIGIVAGLVCFWGATSLKRAMGYDNSLDAFGVHGIGGFVGAILTGVFAVEVDRRRGQARTDRRQWRPGADAALGLPGLHRLVRHRHLHHPQDRRRADRPARDRPKRRSRASTSTCTGKRCTSAAFAPVRRIVHRVREPDFLPGSPSAAASVSRRLLRARRSSLAGPFFAPEIDVADPRRQSVGACRRGRRGSV